MLTTNAKSDFVRQVERKAMKRVQDALPSRTHDRAHDGVINVVMRAFGRAQTDDELFAMLPTAEWMAGRESWRCAKGAMRCRCASELRSRATGGSDGSGDAMDSIVDGRCERSADSEAEQGELVERVQEVLGAIDERWARAIRCAMADCPAAAQRALALEYGVTPRTILNWMEYARLEILVRMGVPVERPRRGGKGGACPRRRG